MKSPYYIVVVAVLVLVGVGLLALPVAVRALPGRYASRLPEPLQALRQKDHPLTLPTPAGKAPADGAAAQAGSTTAPTEAPTATSTPAPTATPPPTAVEPSITPSPTATETPLPTATPARPAVELLTGLRHERQGWNNCGPTTLAMALSYWGRSETQFDIAPLLKPDPEDKHVSVYELRDYARGLGFEAMVRPNGTLEGLKRLISTGYPVIVRSWYVRDARDQLGHYRLVIGYDDATREFDLYDSLYDPPTTIGYQELYELWRVMNWSYLVIAPPEQWAEVTVLVSPDLDEIAAYEALLARAQAEVESPPDSCMAYASCSDWTTFGWFTIGTNLTALGRHEEAAEAYDRARELGLHYRMLWYQHGPYESYYEARRYEDVIALADATLATAANLEESYLWRGKARLALGDAVGAESDFRTALRYHEGWEPALAELEALGE
jgi:hypothetical protein